MGMGGLGHAPAALTTGKRRVPLYRRLGGPQGRSGGVRKSRQHMNSIPGLLPPRRKLYFLRYRKLPTGTKENNGNSRSGWSASSETSPLGPSCKTDQLEPRFQNLFRDFHKSSRSDAYQEARSLHKHLTFNLQQICSKWKLRDVEKWRIILKRDRQTDGWRNEVGPTEI
jgi:hypothetical protein